MVIEAIISRIITITTIIITVTTILGIVPKEEVVADQQGKKITTTIVITPIRIIIIFQRLTSMRTIIIFKKLLHLNHGYRNRELRHGEMPNVQM